MLAPSPQDLDQLLGALSHVVRRQVLEQLRDGESTAGDLARPHDMSLPAISRHLKVLEEAKLVTRRIDGRVHYLTLVPSTLRQLDDWLSHYRWFWESQLDSLAEHLEGPKGRK